MKPIIHLHDSLPSTNSHLQILAQQTQLPEGYTILARNQTAGKGQRGNLWEARPFENLTFSTLLYPTFLQPQEAFWLNIVVSLAILETLQREFKIAVQVKWANDIFFQDKKLAGILIENEITQQKIEKSIIGVGLNVNQKEFEEKKALSLFQILNQKQDIEVLANRILETFAQKYELLQAAEREKLRNAYLQNLYRYQEWHIFLVEGRKVAGQIIGIDKVGRLAVEMDNKVKYFGLKEIQFL
ncbi:biotin--[acetyl-CoA-carboxylase] ligase [Hugenholtzia roseola]|uniref:biotin--[acetyl-CoA-carboxylase] ligase n=1 Tax=Hugenholtzia roseola TaxID=1002 RepID=UPI0012B62C98|nr:biotin--[acetyl-CoA-carboxylase] ligase [Hugenholtzia roseola]